MGAVKTPTGHQLKGKCGKTHNYHALGWQVEPKKTHNRQKVHILSFHPRSPGEVASATWRLPLLSRMLSPRFPIGAPLQHGGVRLTQPRRFRDWQFWVWLFHFVSMVLCGFINLHICKRCTDYVRTWFILLTNPLDYYNFLFWLIDGNPWLLSSILQKSSLFSGKHTHHSFCM